jgi:hypothetical protein
MAGARETGREGEMIVPGNNRKMQKRRAPRRKLFGKVAKERFLEELAANCNVQASADAIGYAVGTVYAHRMKDREFAAAWWVALEQGAAKLVALRLQHDVAEAERLSVAGDQPPPADTALNLLKLMTQLHQHVPGLSGAAKTGAAAAGGEHGRHLQGIGQKAAGVRGARGSAPLPCSGRDFGPGDEEGLGVHAEARRRGGVAAGWCSQCRGIARGLAAAGRLLFEWAEFGSAGWPRDPTSPRLCVSARTQSQSGGMEHVGRESAAGAAAAGGGDR